MASYYLLNPTKPPATWRGRAVLGHSIDYQSLHRCQNKAHFKLRQNILPIEVSFFWRKIRHCDQFYDKSNMALFLILLCCILGSTQATWPLCATNPKHQRIGSNRNWTEWIQRKSSLSDIKVYVYDAPPFNWLHPVRATVFYILCVIWTQKIVSLFDNFLIDVIQWFRVVLI